MSIFASRKKCFCAFCKSERKIYTKRRINIFNIFAAAITSVVMMVVIWQAFDPRVMLLFITFLAVAETFVQIRWRLSIVCKHCGFDPVLYVKNSDQAALKVKLTLERRKDDPASILRAPLNLPTIKKRAESALDKERKASRAGQLISKEV